MRYEGLRGTCGGCEDYRRLCEDCECCSCCCECADEESIHLNVEETEAAGYPVYDTHEGGTCD